MDILLPEATKESADVSLARVSAARRELPFSDRVMDFVAAMSGAILSNREFRNFPELMAMAHWFRAANLRDLRDALRKDEEHSRHKYLPRGVVFHIAPSNVDSVFIYSWLVAMLCGNANIVRLSRRRSAQMQTFLSLVAKLLEQPAYADIAAANRVVSYDHDAEVTGRLSSLCHLRVIWGGDATIRAVRAVPLPPLSTEIAFANRFSLAVLRSKEVGGLDDAGLQTLVRNFYNDAFWFNQQACSSPRAVIWIGSADENRAAQERFWPALAQEIERKKPENHPAHVMNRLTTLFRLANDHAGARIVTPRGALPSRIGVEELVRGDRSCHDGNGLFIEVERAQLHDIAPMLESSDQTIAYFGVTPSEWVELAPSLPPHAADRIVPIGQALAFGVTWDGINLLQSFTRAVVIK